MSWSRSRGTLEQLLGAGGEVVVGADSFDLGGERVDHELVDAVAANAGNGVAGEIVGQPSTSACDSAEYLLLPTLTGNR
jgi:hypothetical protein